ncbi:MAG TPA: hypothetical protein VJ822_16705 [Dongiaceae bacterium]|nr:hypothetical protein [Dongiaceae bacterium]
MLAHLLNAAVRSLAVTVVLGSILLYATGGPDSENARAMGSVIAMCFFLFWITFFFMFGPRVPKHQDGRDESVPDSATHLVFRGRRRRDEEESGHSGESSEHSDSGGGGD